MVLNDGLKESGIWTDQLFQDIAGLWPGGIATHEWLYGDTDQNIKVRFTNGKKCVLKITASGTPDTAAVIKLQIAALLHIDGKTSELSCQVPIAALNGEYIQKVQDAKGGIHFAWSLTWLPGRILDDLVSYDDGLLHSIGQSMALVDRALLDFDHSVAHRHLSWDLANILELRQWLNHIVDMADRQLAAAAFGLLERELLPALQGRPKTIIHNDGGNQHNMLLPADKDEYNRISGVIDFGDIVYTHRICELGIATAYATFGCSDPVQAICLTASGYHEALPLDETDCRLLPMLVVARYLASVSHAAERVSREPNNVYAQVSAESAWRGLRFMMSQDMQQITQRLDGQLADV